jgi:hypothetical protein
MLTAAAALYVYRNHWIPVLEYVLPEQAYERLRPSTFANDVEAGLSSDAFSLAGNVEAGDSRAGLDVAAKKEILRIMKRRNVHFDEARRIFMERKLAKNGIAPDGRPTGTRAFLSSPLPRGSLIVR